MPRVLIAGCGYVGSATADLFHAAHWDVEGWTRSESSVEKPYAMRAVDISDRGEVESVAREFDVIIHCASSGGGGVKSYRQVYFQGAQNLLALQPRIFLFTSSTSVYAQTNGEWVDEESPAEPARESGHILRETEELVRQNRGIIARLAGIYGPGRSALLRKFLSGEACLEGGGDRFINQVHRDDIAAALFLLIGLPNEQRTDSAIFNVADDQPITQRACYQWLAQKLGRPLPPDAPARERRKRGASNKRVSNARLRRLGWKPQYPTFASGMERSVLSAAGISL